MIRTVTICALIALLAEPPAMADPLVVSLVTDDSHFPYAYLEQGRPVGIYVKIVEAVLSRMPGYEARITALPWKRALHLTETGEASGIFPPHYFPTVRPYLDLYSDPILPETPVLQCNEATLAAHGIDRKNAAWPGGYAGITVARPMGNHMGGDELQALFEANGITVITAGGGVIENLRALAHGRTDCIVNDRLTVRAATAWLLKKEPALPLAAITEVAVFPVEPGYLALSGPAARHDPFRQTFLAEFNVRLRHLREDGTLDQIVEDYLKQLTS